MSDVIRQYGEKKLKKLSLLNLALSYSLERNNKFKCLICNFEFQKDKNVQGLISKGLQNFIAISKSIASSNQFQSIAGIAT